MPRRPNSRRMPWAAYLWPGLPHLWNEGSWAGLALAVGFTFLLNTLILATFAWTDWLPERVKLVCGLSTGLLWLLALLETRSELRRQAVRQAAEVEKTSATLTPDTTEPLQTETEKPSEEYPSKQLDEILSQAQQHYLAADWVRAEQALRQLLRIDRDDIEGQLLLASVYRRSGRVSKANRLISRLSRRQDAEGWSHELQAERQQLAANESNTATSTSTSNQVEMEESGQAEVISLAQQRGTRDNAENDRKRAA